jgi:hypothetical protein
MGTLNKQTHYCLYNARFCAYKGFNKIKAKAVPQHTYGGSWGEMRYSSYSFMISALDGLSGQFHAPAALWPR